MQSFPLKLGYGDPDMYLGAKFYKTRLHNGVQAWVMSPRKYVHVAVRNNKAHLGANYSGRYRLPKRAENPFVMVCDLEMDVNQELRPDTGPYIQFIIVILTWMIKQGRD